MDQIIAQLAGQAIPAAITMVLCYVVMLPISKLTARWDARR